MLVAESRYRLTAHKENVYVYDVNTHHFFKAVFEILAILLTLKTIANAIFSICRSKGTEIYHIYGRISEKSFDLY